MTKSDWAIVLSVVAILLAVPSFVGFMWDADVAMAALVVLLLVTIVGTILEALRREREPNWTILEHCSELVIHDEDGRRAICTKKLRLRCNCTGLNTYTHRNLSADGNLRVTSVTGGKIAQQSVIAGDHHVVVEFPTHKKRGEIVETTLTASLRDSFLGRPEESFTLLADQDLRYARVVITLPAPPPKVMVIRHHLGMGAPGGIAEINGNSIRWELKPVRLQRRIPPGGEYEVRWTWPTTS